jgi:stage II sporulation protein D
MPWLLGLVLTAAPLSIRVLEREHATRASIEAEVLRCEGEEGAAPKAPALGEARDGGLPSVSLSVARGAVQIGPRRCAMLLASGAITVRSGTQLRRYPGTLRVSSEREELRFVVEADVEAYLPSVVTAELDAAPPAALEAQAVVSRTFALGSRKRHGDHDLCDLTHCQSFAGLTVQRPAALEAVRRTQGLVLLAGGVTLEPTFFHAACGGHTSRPIDVFHVRSAAPGVSDVLGGKPLCATAPDFAWSVTVDRLELARALGTGGDGNVFEPLRRDEARRVIELRAFGRRFSGADFLSRVGRAFGWRSVRSLKLDTEEVDQQVRFSGTGLGHGVGLCQHGARALAERGQDGQAILGHYFPHARVARL